MDAKISPSFWSDPDIEMQPPEIKLAYLWLLTNSQTTVCGFCQVSARRFSFETGLKPEMLDRVCEALPRALKPFKDQNIIYARKYIHHQLGRAEQLTRNNIFKSVVSCWKSITHAPLKSSISEDYPEISKPLATPSKGLQAQREGEGEGEGEVIEGVPGGTLAPPMVDAGICVNEFNQFWDAYPRKAKIYEAQRAFVQVNAKPALPQILAALQWQTKSEEWKRDGGRYVPTADNYLRDGRWNDEPARQPQSLADRSFVQQCSTANRICEEVREELKKLT